MLYLTKYLIMKTILLSKSVITHTHTRTQDAGLNKLLF